LVKNLPLVLVIYWRLNLVRKNSAKHYPSYLDILINEAYEPNINVEKQSTVNIQTEEVDENLQNELIDSYRKIIERDEIIFKLTNELAELRINSSMN
jgi:hypothetical protein